MWVRLIIRDKQGLNSYTVKLQDASEYSTASVREPTLFNTNVDWITVGRVVEFDPDLDVDDFEQSQGAWVVSYGCESRVAQAMLSFSANYCSVLTAVWTDNHAVFDDIKFQTVQGVSGAASDSSGESTAWMMYLAIAGVFAATVLAAVVTRRTIRRRRLQADIQVP